jgi:hypothetical protein
MFQSRAFSTITVIYLFLLGLAVSLQGQALITNLELNLSEDLIVNADKSQAILMEGDLQLTVSVDPNEYSGALLGGIAHSDSDWGIDILADRDDVMNWTFNKPVRIKILSFRRARGLSGDEMLEFRVNGALRSTITGTELAYDFPPDYNFSPVIQLQANQTLTLISKYTADEPFSFACELVANKLVVDVIPETSSYALFLGCSALGLLGRRRFIAKLIGS